MSAISSSHSITDYVSGISEPLDSNVLVVSRGNTKSNTKSICASIPAIDKSEIVEAIEELIPHIQDMVTAARSKIIRATHADGKLEVTTEQVSLSSVIAYLNAESGGGRLTKEEIAKFLSEPLQADTLKAAFALQLKWHNEPLTEEQSDRLNKMHKALSDTMSDLAGSRTAWEEKKINTTSRYITALEDSAMKSRLVTKLEAMKEKLQKQDDIMDALGF